MLNESVKIYIVLMNEWLDLVNSNVIELEQKLINTVEKFAT